MTASIAPASSRSHSSIPPSTPSGVPSSNSSTYSVRVDEKTQEVVFTGILRPFTADQMAPIRSYLEKAAWSAATSAKWTLDLNFKRLKHMNNVAFLELNRFVKWAAEALPELKIKLVISSVVPWALSKFQIFAELYEHVSVDTYDRTLYPVQQVIEDDEFVKVLQTQSKIIWAREQELLPRHGLRSGMRIADIGCGLGGFAIQIQHDFRPSYLVGVDHSQPFLKRAQRVVREYGLENIEYQYGDAASLLLPDDSFDFVSCRLSLQVFHHPDRIMRELYRICRPGGRVYITNEMMSCIAAYPNAESVRWAYDQIIKMGVQLGMDMDAGIKTRERLLDADFEDIKVDVVEITNMNTDPVELAKIVDSWAYVIERMAAQTKTSADVYERVQAGHRDHIGAILNDHGYTTWPIFIGSGRKPYRISSRS